MTEVRETLDRLGLGEYADAFIEEGFDTWAIVTEITESDLTDLGVKLGHRREIDAISSQKLQRAIADHRQRSIETSPWPRDKVSPGGSTRESSGPVRDRPKEGPTKRKYKRHPKPDVDAPERPASAYVLFSNDMRELLKDRELSFTEMAKVVGERWQVLPVDERDSYESTAAAAKERYLNAMAEYKKTDNYARYQQYLADFKARHTTQPQSASGSKRNSHDLALTETLTRALEFPKRAKLETETSTETQSSLDDHQSAPGRTSASHYYKPGHGGYASYRDEPYSNSGSPATALYSTNASPAHHSNADSYSQHGSPPSSSSRHTPYEIPQYAATRGPRDRAYSSLHDHDPTSQRQPSLVHQASTGSGASLPPLSKDLSSRGSVDSPLSPTGPPLQALMKDGLPPSSRILPSPVTSSGFPLEHRTLPAPNYSPHDDDPRQSSSLAALLRASELASEADRLRESTMDPATTRSPRP